MPKPPFPLCLALLLTLAVPALTRAQTCPPTPTCFVALGDADRTTYLNPDAIVAVEILDADHLRVVLQGGHEVHLSASPTTFWPALAQGCGDGVQPQGFLGDLVWDAAQRVTSNPERLARWLQLLLDRAVDDGSVDLTPEGAQAFSLWLAEGLELVVQPAVTVDALSAWVAAGLEILAAERAS